MFEFSEVELANADWITSFVVSVTSERPDEFNTTCDYSRSYSITKTKMYTDYHFLRLKIHRLKHMPAVTQRSVLKLLNTYSLQ